MLKSVRIPGVMGRRRIEEAAMVAVIMFGWVVWVRHGRVPVKLLGAIVRVMA